MRPITLQQPQRIVFGTGCIHTFVEEYQRLGLRRLFVLTAPPIRPLIDQPLADLQAAGITVDVVQDIVAEPTLNDFNAILERARQFQADSVAGIGGGSVLDVAKLVAAFTNSHQEAADCFGTGLIHQRGLWLACLPTTAGTGSEVSPNAILLDERDHLKKGIVSPHLLADVAYVDAQLTWTVPAKVTADTGMDALTHCIEAYTNKFAHPTVDIYALQGIRLIAANLERCVTMAAAGAATPAAGAPAAGAPAATVCGDSVATTPAPAFVEAREALALGSLYGGLCLGPVNTAAVHALSYPLGGEFHIPHGLSNAILLPSVMKFNAEVCPQRYADVAVAFGLPEAATPEQTAARGVDFIYRLAAAVGIPDKLTALGIPQSAVDGMAKAAMDVQRLLKNNPRPVSEQDARDIYNSLY